MDKAIVLDISHKQRPSEQTLILRQGDKASVTLDITILEKGAPFDTTGFDVRFMAMLPDESVIIDPCSPVDPTLGRYSYTTPGALSSTPGAIGMSYIQLVKDDEVIHSTDCFSISIRRSVDITAEQAENYLSEFLQAKAEIDGIIDDGRTQMAQQQTDYEAAEDTRNALYDEAEQSRENDFGVAEAERQEGESFRVATFADMMAAWTGINALILEPGQYDKEGTPTIVGLAGITYLVPKPTKEHDSYYEWIYIAESWERIGSTDVNITPIDIASIDRILAGETLMGNEVLTTTGFAYFAGRLSRKMASTYAASVSYEDRRLSVFSEDGTQIADIPIGSGSQIAGIEYNWGGLVSDIPKGFLPLDGRAVAKERYPALFAVYGTRHNPEGWEDPTKFCLPDRGGRTAIGANDSYPMDSEDGEAKHKLTVDELAHFEAYFQMHNAGTFTNINFVDGMFEARYVSDSYGTLNAAGTAAGSVGGVLLKVGNDVAHNNMQPYYTVNKMVSVGELPDGNTTADQTPRRVAGIIEAWGGTLASIPAGWLPCDGTLYNKADYPDLYDKIGDIWTPAGTPSTKFAVPDGGGRSMLGANSTYPLGSKDGEATHKLKISEMPSHSHFGKQLGESVGLVPQGNYFGVNEGGESSPTGGDQPHNNMHPYFTVNYMISTGRVEDSAGDLVPAGIANAAVTPEKLSNDVRDSLQTDFIPGERKTGQKWIDGKDIYEYTLISTINAQAGADTKIGTTPDLSIDTFLGIKGTGKITTNDVAQNTVVPLPSSHTNSGCIKGIWYNMDERAVRVNCGSLEGVYRPIAFIRYTKG